MVPIENQERPNIKSVYPSFQRRETGMIFGQITIF